MDARRQAVLLQDALALAADGTVLERLVTAAATMLEVSSVTSALVTDESGGGVVAATTAMGRAAFDLEFELGEGPGLASFASGREVLAADLSACPHRWPAYCEAVAEVGVRAAFAFPTRIGAIRLGVLVAHRDRPGPIDEAALDDARVLADICAGLLLDQESGLDEQASLAAGWTHRAVVHQATGMLVARHGVSLATALSRLRAYAFGEGRPLDDVATDVVERRLWIEL